MTRKATSPRTAPAVSSRSLWKGAISFGLVHIPIGLYAATASTDIDFDWLDKRNMQPVGYKRINKVTGKEVASADIVKGVEFEEGRYVVLSAEEIAAAFPKTMQTIEIEAFVDADDIPFIYLERPYYTAPLHRGGKVYALLREALRNKLIAAWPWALTNPGIKAWLPRSIVSVALKRRSASSPGINARIRPLSIASAQFSRTRFSGTTGIIQRAFIIKSIEYCSGAGVGIGVNWRFGSQNGRPVYCKASDQLWQIYTLACRARSFRFVAKFVRIFIVIQAGQLPIQQILCYHRAPELSVRCIFSQSFAWQVVG